MLGTLFSQLIHRKPSIRKCHYTVDPKVDLKADPKTDLDDLCTRIETLKLSYTPTPTKKTSSASTPDQANHFQSHHWMRAPFLYTKRLRHYPGVRFYHSSFVTNKKPKALQDAEHIDPSGSIRNEIIQQRESFLQHHGMMQDKIIHKDRIVYANYHLYNIWQLDANGNTNLKRMENGNCPIGLDGSDLIVIHHLDQSHDGKWVILTNSFHQDHHLKLHSNVSPINRVKRDLFQEEKNFFWKSMAAMHLEWDKENRPTRRYG